MMGWTEGLNCKAWTTTDPTDRVRLLYIQKP
jgi:hypothetical protein